jgi:malonyl-CoA decarboxylase
VVDELGAELPKINNFSTLSPVPHLARALHSRHDHHGFSRERLLRLVCDFAPDLARESGQADAVDGLLHLLKNPAEHQKALAAPLKRLTLAYLTQVRAGEKPHDAVAQFHWSNGARLESIDPFANLRPYGLRDSFGVMVNYRYIPGEVEENHERFVVSGEMRVSSSLAHEQRVVAELWRGEAGKAGKHSHSAG